MGSLSVRPRRPPIHHRTALRGHLCCPACGAPRSSSSRIPGRPPPHQHQRTRSPSALDVERRGIRPSRLCGVRPTRPCGVRPSRPPLLIRPPPPLLGCHPNRLLRPVAPHRPATDPRAVATDASAFPCHAVHTDPLAVRRPSSLIRCTPRPSPRPCPSAVPSSRCSPSASPGPHPCFPPALRARCPSACPRCAVRRRLLGLGAGRRSRGSAFQVGNHCDVMCFCVSKLQSVSVCIAHVRSRALLVAGSTMK